jgi:hypothetical protein
VIFESEIFCNESKTWRPNRRSSRPRTSGRRERFLHPIACLFNITFLGCQANSVNGTRRGRISQGVLSRWPARQANRRADTSRRGNTRSWPCSRRFCSLWLRPWHTCRACAQAWSNAQDSDCKRPAVGSHPERDPELCQVVGTGMQAVQCFAVHCFMK